MSSIEFIKSMEQIKLLSDPRRMAILRLLMAQPATLTLLGKALGEHRHGCATTSNNWKKPGW